MNTEGKVWGRTTEIAQTETSSVHYLEILAGGYSSKHRHRIKTNLFFLIAGMVKITAWRKGGTDETTIMAGESIAVGPGIWHKFEALEESEMIEIYTVRLEHPDIERAGTGGLVVPEGKDPILNHRVGRAYTGKYFDIKKALNENSVRITKTAIK